MHPQVLHAYAYTHTVMDKLKRGNINLASLMQRVQSRAAQPWHWSRASWCLESMAEAIWSHPSRQGSKEQTGIRDLAEPPKVLPWWSTSASQNPPPKRPQRNLPSGHQVTNHEPRGGISDSNPNSSFKHCIFSRTTEEWSKSNQSFPLSPRHCYAESPKSPWDCNALAEITGKMTPPNQKFTMSSSQMTTGSSS